MLEAVCRTPSLRRVPSRAGRGLILAFADAIRRRGARARGRDPAESSFDLDGCGARRGLLIRSWCRTDAIRRSNDKAETTSSSIASACRHGVPTRNGAGEVDAAARELGYPDRPVCFKPVFSSGSRGFRILDPTVDRAHQLLNERPGSVSMRLEEAVELLPEEGAPTVAVMELATGGERTIIGNGREIVLGHPKTREAMRAGLAMYFVTLDDAGADAI